MQNQDSLYQNSEQLPALPAECARSSNPPLQIRLRSAGEPLRKYVISRIPEGTTQRIGVDDILQEVWIAAFRAEGMLQGLNDDQLLSWLVSVAKYILISHLRFHLNQKRDAFREIAPHDMTTSLVGLAELVVAPQRTPSSLAALNEVAQQVKSAIESLPYPHDKAIWMHHIEGLDKNEIASRLNCSTDAVRGYLYRGLTLLSDVMRGKSPGSSGA